MIGKSTLCGSDRSQNAKCDQASQVRRLFEDESKKEKTPAAEFCDTRRSVAINRRRSVLELRVWRRVIAVAAAVAAAAKSPGQEGLWTSFRRWKTLVSGRGLTQR